MKTNKLLSLILSFIFVFTSLLTCLPAGNAIASTIALYDEDLKSATVVLNEICPGFPLADGESVTRAEFVTAVTMLLGKGIETNVPTGFVDVPAEYAYSGNIKYAKDLGLISNVEIFSPDVPVTYAQAIKILMCATGHGQKAEFMGGYPAGYFKVANDAKVGEYVSLGADASLTHKEAISLIFEAACTDILDATAFGDSYEYAEIEGKNILSVIHKIYMAEGIASANKITGLYSASSNTDSNGISVNGKEYYGEGYNNLLGKKVRVFFKDENKRNIVAAYGVDNKTYSFTHEDSLKLSGSTIDVFYSEADKKEERFYLESEYAVIFNGKYYAASQSSYNAAINPDSGIVEFIDNNGNGKIDVIIAKSIEYGVVDSVNAIEGKIYDKFKQNGMRVVSDEIDYSITDMEGNAIELFDITQNTVVGYIESEDGKALEIIKFSDRMAGTYTELSSNNVLVLGKEKEVVLSKYFTENIKALSNIKMGTQIIAYLGIGNQVVYIEEYADSLRYGYLSGFATVGSGLTAIPCVKIYSDEGKMIELNLAEKLVYNGTSGVSRAVAASNLETLKTQPFAMRVIKFATNANGELSKIYEAQIGDGNIDSVFTTPSQESRPQIFQTQQQVENSQYSIRFKYGIFFPYYTVKTGGMIMQVLSSAEEEEVYDEQNYRMYSLTQFTALDDDEQGYRAYGYDVSKDGAAFVLWVSSDPASKKVDEFSAWGVVESKTKAVNEDGNVVSVINVYSGGAWKKLYSPSSYELNPELEETVKLIQPGDVVRVEANSKNTLTDCRIDFSYSGYYHKTVDGNMVKYAKDSYTGSYEKETFRVFEPEGTTNHVATSDGQGKYVGYTTGYIYYIGGGLAMVEKTNKDIDVIAGTEFTPDDMYPVKISGNSTIFVELKKDRSNPNIIVSADVYKEPDISSVESYFNAGKDADYLVSRARLRAPILTVIYVN